MAQLLSNLAIGAKIKFGNHQVGSELAAPIVWIIADKNHSGYPSNSVTLVTEKIIDLRAYDSYGGSYDDAADIEMAYPHSNIHKWLNSSATAGNWWTSTYSGDTKPTAANTQHGTEYGDRAGFLYNFTEAEKSILLTTTFTAQWGETLSSMAAKVFLPSTYEMIGTGTKADGSTRFSHFQSVTARATLTSQAFTNTQVASYYKPASLSTYCAYHCRNAYGLTVRGINASGEVGTWKPNDGSKGVRPVVNIPINTKISDTADSDGCYAVLPQSVPVISGDNGDLGIKGEGFTQTYTVSDGDNEVVTVKEYIDNALLRSYVATLDAVNTFDVTGKTWLTLANGNHTMKIVVTDGIDEVTRTFTFTKSISSLVVQRTEPIASLYRPTNIIVTVVKNIPYNATMKVEACNNGFDAKPTWEDITDSVTSGLTHVFANKSSTSINWGVNVRVTVDRNGSEGACYITEIGGNFE